MTDIKITPTCKYGHGPLDREQGAWSFLSAPSSVHDDHPLGFKQGELAYAVSLHVCRVCGYMEMFDYPEVQQ